MQRSAHPKALAAVALAAMVLAGAGAGSVVTVTDAEGTTVAALTTTTAIQSLVASTPDLVAGATYTVSVDGAAVVTTFAS